jgi:hypothetical protein
MASAINHFNFNIASELRTHAGFYMLPIFKLISGNEHSFSIMFVLRTVFNVTFILSGLVLIFFGPFFKNSKRRILFALVYFGTYSFWQYSIEIRHDTMILLGNSFFLLGLAYFFEDPKRSAKYPSLISAFGLAFTFTTSFKGFMYSLCFLFGLGVFSFIYARYENHKKIALNNYFWMTAGFFICLAFLMLLTMRFFGGLEVYWNHLRNHFVEAKSSIVFSAWPLILDTGIKNLPLLFLFIWTLYLSIKKHSFWKNPLGLLSFCYFLGVTGLLFLNPAPFHYNIIHVQFWLLATLLVFWGSMGKAIKPMLIYAFLMIHWSYSLFQASNDDYFLAKNTKQIEYIENTEKLVA